MVKKRKLEGKTGSGSLEFQAHSLEKRAKLLQKTFAD